MTVSDIFEKAIQIGIKYDCRGENNIKNILDERKIFFDKLSDEKKEYYNKAELFNPFLDSAIHHDSGKEIKKIFVGIDTEIQEIIAADKKNADLILGHHPEGRALVDLWRVMNIHQEELSLKGIPVNIAEKLVSERESKLERNLHPVNFNRAVSAAKELDISFLNLHTIADNIANRYMENFLKNKTISTLQDICDSVLEIPEYDISAKNGVTPILLFGNELNRAGNIFVKFNGGTSGNEKIFKHLETFNINTFICMHLPQNHIEEAEKYNINVIVMPHMASDSIGMNLLLDELFLGIQNIEIINGSGFLRFCRNNI
ncbi:NGG1p interacting factor NIF3 [Candidatus Gracilibacteria bacterium]|nr:NGG1p interacting factor NIF3 [Candidatus Gracilibacteria bacterium]